MFVEPYACTDSAAHWKQQAESCTPQSDAIEVGNCEKWVAESWGECWEILADQSAVETCNKPIFGISYIAGCSCQAIHSIDKRGIEGSRQICWKLIDWGGSRWPSTDHWRKGIAFN